MCDKLCSNQNCPLAGVPENVKICRSFLHGILSFFCRSFQSSAHVLEAQPSCLPLFWKPKGKREVGLHSCADAQGSTFLLASTKPEGVLISWDGSLLCSKFPQNKYLISAMSMEEVNWWEEKNMVLGIFFVSFDLCLIFTAFSITNFVPQNT